VLRQRAQQLQVTQTPPASNHERSLFQRQDWREAMDVPFSTDAPKNSATLEQWIVQERCRLVVGHGWDWQNRLSVKLAQQTQSQFEYVIYVALACPPIQEMLAD